MSHGDYYQKSLVHIFTALYQFFFEDRNEEYLLTKIKQFAKLGFGEICFQCLTTSI